MAWHRRPGWLAAGCHALFMCFSLGAPQVHAQSVFSAEALRDACIRPVEAWVSFCNGYAQAAVDFVEMAELACVPDNTSRTEIVSEIDRLAFDRIAAGEIPADTPALTLAISVLQTLYPCETDSEASE